MILGKLVGLRLVEEEDLYNDQGVIAFTTGPVDLDPLLHVQPPTGLFRSVCHIPGNLLNSGLHRVSVYLVWGNMATTCRIDDAVGFEVTEQAERTFAWFGREPAAVQPVLDWTTESLGDVPSGGRTGKCAEPYCLQSTGRNPLA